MAETEACLVFLGGALVTGQEMGGGVFSAEQGPLFSENGMQVAVYELVL